MAAAGHDTEVVTLDAPEAPYLAGFGVTVHALGPSAGHYRYNRRLTPWIKAHAGAFDAVVIHGLWQYHSFGSWRALRGMGVPYYIFPHGMLDPWFKRAYPLKHLKKLLYWPWAEYRVLRDARRVLFTCEEERLLAPVAFSPFRAIARVVGFFASAPPADVRALGERLVARFPALRGKRVILFIGRVHPKKGCDLLVEAFVRVAADCPELCLLVAGPAPEQLQAELQAIAKRGGVADRVVWTGLLQDELKWAAFGLSEAMALTSHQENFGVVVAEALACEVPVLISNRVQIWREIDADRAGFVDEDTVAGAERLLRRWLSLAPAAQREMGARARACYERRYTVAAMAASLTAAIAEPQGATNATQPSSAGT
jgi:glycosyltransferase involved in cell wall biosynthesis